MEKDKYQRDLDIIVDFVELVYKGNEFFDVRDYFTHLKETMPLNTIHSDKIYDLAHEAFNRRVRS